MFAAEKIVQMMLKSDKTPPKIKKFKVVRKNILGTYTLIFYNYKIYSTCSTLYIYIVYMTIFMVVHSCCKHPFKMHELHELLTPQKENDSTLKQKLIVLCKISSSMQDKNK